MAPRSNLDEIVLSQIQQQVENTASTLKENQQDLAQMMQMMNQMYIFMKDREHASIQDMQQIQQIAKAPPHPDYKEMIEDLAHSQEESMQALKRDVMLGVAKAIASPAVSQSIAREVKEEIKNVDNRLAAVEEHIQLAREAIGEQTQQMKNITTLQEEVREASMDQYMDQQ